jgi:hypothetical protein
MLKEYIVSLKAGVDYNAFWNEIETDGTSSVYIPGRAVTIVDVRPLSLRSCHYSLSDEEAEQLRNDDRVYCVEIPPSQRDDIGIESHSQTGVYSKIAGTPDSNWVNWGLFRTNSKTNNTDADSGTLTYEYTLDGTGVDIIIQDSGLQCDHPEFQDANGVSRVQKINWWTAAGQTGNPPWYPDTSDHGMPAGFYEDTFGHATINAGVAAGKTYGRAKNARIYVMHINKLSGDTPRPGNQGGIDPVYSFDLITAWHNNKPVDPVTGYKRPTVVNMSWGYCSLFSNITGGNYRGTTWTGTTKQPQYGMLGSANGYYGVRTGSVDAAIEECLAAGVVLVSSAGNYYQTLDVPGGDDYDNYYVNSVTGNSYYMRGCSPNAVSDVITVGAVAISYTDNLEQKVGFSDSGPRVDLYAPGNQIVSSISNVYDARFSTYPAGVNTYPDDPSFKIANVSGTSQASPQVAGMVAQLLQLYPNKTPAEIKQLIIDSSIEDMLYDTGATDDYTVSNSLHGSPNRYAYFPYFPWSIVKNAG